MLTATDNRNKGPTISQKALGAAAARSTRAVLEHLLSGGRPGLAFVASAKKAGPSLPSPAISAPFREE